MPVQLPYIQPLSFEQNNPFIAGRAAGRQDQTAQLANALAQAKLPYAGRRELAETLTQEEQPAFVRAQTGLTTAQTSKVPAEIKELLARANYQGAEAGLTNKKTNWYDREATSRMAEEKQRARLAGTQADWFGTNSQSENAARAAHARYEDQETQEKQYYAKHPWLYGKTQFDQDMAYQAELDRARAAAPPSTSQLTQGMQHISNALSNGTNAGGNAYAPQQLSAQPTSDLANRLRQIMQPQQTQQPSPYDKLPSGLELFANNQQALINKNNATGSFRGLGAVGSSMQQAENQILKDNAGLSEEVASQAVGALLNNESTLPDGSPLPYISPQTREHIRQVWGHNATAKIKDQAATAANTANEIGNIDIEPVKKFAGLKGKGLYLAYSANALAGGKVPQEFRDYESFKNVAAPFAMDTLRKGFGTSVVPSYVTATLGKAADPSSTWWHDAKQVENDWKELNKWLNTYKENTQKQAREGATADLGNALTNTTVQAEKPVSEKTSEKPKGKKFKWNPVTRTSEEVTDE